MAGTAEPETANVNATKAEGNKAQAPRKIPGNLPYLTAFGTLKRALERLIDASRPDKFNADFLENVLKLTGGAARGTIPILKKMGFLTSDGSPTDLYAKFRTESSRPAAALAGLRNAFPEIFKRSEYAHSVNDSKIKDIILEITGLKTNDPIAQSIKSTFNAIKSFIPAGTNFTKLEDETSPSDDMLYNLQSDQEFTSRNLAKSQGNLGLVYNINIVIPETSDLKILNAIFRSIKDNLL